MISWYLLGKYSLSGRVHLDRRTHGTAVYTCVLLRTGAPGHRLSAFLFLNFYRDFQVKILYGIPNTIFKNPLYRDFPVKFFPAVFGPLGLGWPPGGPSGCSACARGDARYRETPRTAARHRLPKSGSLVHLKLV